MICQECRDNGQKSVVRAHKSGVEWPNSYGDSFYDEEGHPHDHNPNTYVFGHICSNGHVWSTEMRMECGRCGHAWRDEITS